MKIFSPILSATSLSFSLLALAFSSMSQAGVFDATACIYDQDNKVVISDKGESVYIFDGKAVETNNKFSIGEVMHEPKDRIRAYYLHTSTINTVKSENQICWTDS